MAFHEDTEGSLRPSLDPIATLQLQRSVDASEIASPGSAASVSSLCFVGGPSTPLCQSQSRDEGEDDSSDEDSDEDCELILRTSALTKGETRNSSLHTHQVRQVAASVALDGSYLASSHGDGSSYLWDLGKRQVVHEFTPNRGPSLVMRRTNGPEATSNVLYHTRDEDGTVSLHDVGGTSDNHVPIVSQFQTKSRTFCAASPCISNPNLVALPSEQDVVTIVRDWRQAPTSPPVACLHGAGMKPSDPPSVLRKHGMITSLAISETCSAGRMILAGGMESGSVFFHDLAMPGQTSSQMDLSKEPILALDLTPSFARPKASVSNAESVVAIAGMAGDSEELAGRPEDERGTVALIKSTLGLDGNWTCRLRARLATCELGESHKSGKPGVAICRFRPDGRLFAVGGWDRRLRIFDRAACAKAPCLAILKGHTGSVSAVDWSPDAAISGVLATGSSDGRIYIWRSFSRTSIIS